MNPYEVWRTRYPEAAAALQQILTPVEPSPSGWSEARVQSLVRLASVEYGALWRNNAGQAELNGQPVRFGLGNESKKFWENWRSGDLVGITRITVQPHHIGRTFGVFTMCEIKKAGWVKPTDQRERAQMNCLTHVTSLGGIAGFVTSEEAYRDMVDRYVRGG